MMKLIPITALLLLSLIVIGDVALYLILAIWLWGAWHFQYGKTAKITIAACAVALIAANMSGFIVFGSSPIRYSQLITNPQVLERIEKPSILISQDGRETILGGIEFTQQFFDLRMEDQIAMLTKWDKSLRYQASSAASDHAVVFEQRIAGWCGNSFYLHFFPKPLKSHVLKNLADEAVNSGWAVRTNAQVQN